jgi:5-methylcytosine-specific restriction endonuclease McrA
MQYVECLICNKRLKFISNTHLKKHSLNCKTYLELFPNSSLKTEEYKLSSGLHAKGKKYNEIYGNEKAEQLIELRRENAITQFKDENQRVLRSIALKGVPKSEEVKKKLSISKTIHGGNNFRRRAIEFYGFKCMRCDKVPEKSNQIVVHHRDHVHTVPELTDNSIENLEVLCKPCHSKEHNKYSPGKFSGLSDLDKGAAYIARYFSKNFVFNVSNFNLESLKDYILRFYEKT